MRDFVAVARDTIALTNNGWYKNKKGEKITFGRDLEEVNLFSPNELDEIVKTTKKEISKIKTSSVCEIALIDEDTFVAARTMDYPLVLNFADAHTPGGLFLSGAATQEECLCRCSTLYKSIASDKARVYYDYNDAACDPFDTDYLIISPNVYIFRDRDCEVLDTTKKVAVATLPAPITYNCRHFGMDKLESVMKTRLEKLFSVAYKKGFKNLVLGAWGCGAFGGDPNLVANIFKMLLNSGFDKTFKKIIFAIYGGKENLNAFKKVFE